MKVNRLDLGCGTNKPDNFIGVDIYPGSGVDIVADLNTKFPFEDNSVDEVRAHDVIEHLPDKMHTMNEIWRICKPGAVVDIRVPSTDGRGAFQDPTHVSFWNINSFLYYCVDFPSYLQLCQRYGFKGAFKVLQLEHEESSDKIVHVRAELSVVKSEIQLTNKLLFETQKIEDNAIVSKKQKIFTDEVYIDKVIKELTYKLYTCLENYQQYPNNCEVISNFRYALIRIAEHLLCLSLDELKTLYLEQIEELFNKIINSGIKNEPLTETEQKFADKILDEVAKGFNEPKAIQHLLVAMLYLEPQQLPVSKEISLVPDWLLNDYLKYLINYLFISNSYFRQVGEANNYYNYMQSWVDCLHSSISSEHNSNLWNVVLENFVSIANFIPLYFNDNNLKDIYVKRAEIIEYVLKANNCELDYEFPNRTTTRRKIRLGILASHFMPSSETFAYLPVYEYLSRDFEVILYSLTETGHPLEQYCQSCANSFKLLPKNLTAQVNTIRADDLDILFIATNVTAVTNQICLLSTHRLARIQTTSGGSVVTTGMRNIDYYISGTLTDPSPTAHQHYQEKLVKLEGTAHCFSYGTEQDKVTVEVERTSLGFSDDAVVFISGANYFKTIPELVNTWAKIIAEVPNSVLVLLPFGPNWSNAYPKKAFINHLQLIFSAHGVKTERLIVLDPQPVPDRQDVKEYFKIADVYLDSYPFAGTTSLIEPLQVNLPVISREGSYFRSAMGAAMLKALDVSGLVAHSEESYIELAIALGNNPELRQQKSAKIKKKMQNNPCFLDSRSYSAKIGNLFQELFSNYLQDSLKQNLNLTETNLIIFPDWSQSEEVLYNEVKNVIASLVHSAEQKQMTLLINIGNLDEDDVSLFLSDIVMNLLLQEELDITDCLEISLVGQLDKMQWETLLPQIQARIVLESENHEAIALAKAETLTAENINKPSDVEAAQHSFFLS